MSSINGSVPRALPSSPFRMNSTVFIKSSNRNTKTFGRVAGVEGTNVLVGREPPGRVPCPRLGVAWIDFQLLLCVSATPRFTQSTSLPVVSPRPQS